MEENKTIEQITKSYEEKIAQREKEFMVEKEQMKQDMAVQEAVTFLVKNAVEE